MFFVVVLALAVAFQYDTAKPSPGREPLALARKPMVTSAGGTGSVQETSQQEARCSEDLNTSPLGYGSAIFNRRKFVQVLNDIHGQTDVDALRKRTLSVRNVVESPERSSDGFSEPSPGRDTVSLRRDVLVSELNQILEARTIERARYYVNRLRDGVQKVRKMEINDINLLRWKEYENVVTDSLWVIDRRDSSGGHLGWYWGNFVPQIPQQMMLRYTRRQDWVIDAFAGSGTTLIECRRLGRNGIGLELNKGIAAEAEKLVDTTRNDDEVTTKIVVGDSRKIDIRGALEKNRVKQVQLLIMHPPYHDIIRFSDDSGDLSNAGSTERFLQMFGQTVDNLTPYLETDRYFALVVGDKYSRGEWMPLGFYCMNEVLRRSYALKSIVVKNYDETRSKRHQAELWRYRALAGGFYVFKHEYIFIFRKTGDASTRV